MTDDRLGWCDFAVSATRRTSDQRAKRQRARSGWWLIDRGDVLVEGAQREGRPRSGEGGAGDTRAPAVTRDPSRRNSPREFTAVLEGAVHSAGSRDDEWARGIEFRPVGRWNTR